MTYYDGRSGSRRMGWDIDSQIRDIIKQKKERQQELARIDESRYRDHRRDMADEKARLKAQGVHERGQAAIDWLGRKNDAFEVSAGRMDPMFFNAKYGGSAPSSSGSGNANTSRGSAARSAQPDYATMLIDAYKASGKDELGTKEDFLSFSERTLPQLQKDFPAAEQPIDPWEMRRKKNAMDYGSRTTKDFQDNMTTSRTPEGALRFSDNGVRENDIRFSQGWNDETKNKIKNFDHSLIEKKPLYKKSLRDYKVTPKPKKLLMESFDDPFYKEKPAWQKKRDEEKRKQQILQNREYLRNLNNY